MKRQQLNVEAVIFDMDGVITDTMPKHYEAWRRSFAAEGMTVGRKMVYLHEGEPGKEFLENYFRERGDFPEHERLDRLLKRKEKIFKLIVKPRFVSGARSFLRGLKKEGLRLGLVTGTSKDEVPRVLVEEYLSLFDVVITGSDVKKGKPSPEPYKMALRRLNIPASAAFVLENAPLGIRSAKKAGLRCFALTTSLAKEYLAGADGLFRTIKEFQTQVSIRKR